MFRWCRRPPVRPNARPRRPSSTPRPDAVVRTPAHRTGTRAPAPSTRPTPSLHASQMFLKPSNVPALTEHLKVSGTCSAGATRLRLTPTPAPSPRGPASPRPHLPPVAVDRAPAPSTRPTPSLRASQMFWKTSNVPALTEHLKVSGTCSTGATHPRRRLSPPAHPPRPAAVLPHPLN